MDQRDDTEHDESNPQQSRSRILRLPFSSSSPLSSALHLLPSRAFGAREEEVRALVLNRRQRVLPIETDGRGDGEIKRPIRSTGRLGERRLQSHVRVSERESEESGDGLAHARELS